MRLPALVALATTVTACATTPDPYSVDAAAELAPVETQIGGDAGITGPLEILGSASPVPTPDYQRTIAAYKVHLGKGAAPWVRIYDAASCEAPGDAPKAIADLGVIRRVGDEVHFFAPHVEVDGRPVDIDTGTVTADVTLNPAWSHGYAVGKLAVVQWPGDSSVPSPGGSGSDIPPGGEWLSCGVIELR